MDSAEDPVGVDKPDEDLQVVFGLGSDEVFLRSHWSWLFLFLEEPVVEENAVPSDTQDSRNRGKPAD